KNNMLSNSYLINQGYYGYKDYNLKFTNSDSVAYIEGGVFLYFYNLKRSEEGKIREIKKITIKNSRYTFSNDGKFLFIINGYSDSKKAETVSIYDVSSLKFMQSIELPLIYSNFIKRSQTRPLSYDNYLSPKYDVNSFCYVDNKFYFIYRNNSDLIYKLKSYPGKREIRIP